MAEQPTKSIPRDVREVSYWQLELTCGPGRGGTLDACTGTVKVGSSDANHLVVRDERVSRRHLEIDLSPEGPVVRDRGSKNGTFFLGSRIEAAVLPLHGGVVSLGDSELTIRPVHAASVPSEPVARDHLGRLIGASRVMRELYHRIERIAPSDATVLIGGETGSGKELVAEAVHELSGRRNGPFVVIDCGAIPPGLLESQLFGHLKGSFTGAIGDRVGAFEDARGGTLFLDEIAELALELQPKLLRALAGRKIKPVGAAREIDVDVRVIAATHRDLVAYRAEGRFREDLYYRLSVIDLRVPSLRERLDDVPAIADHLLREAGSPPLGADSLRTLMAYDWPGNVRQLRNVLEQAVALSGGAPPVVSETQLDTPAARSSPSRLLRQPYKKAKDELVSEFTREYIEALLERHDGKVLAAAREAGLDRNWLVALAHRSGVRVKE